MSTGPEPEPTAESTVDSFLAVWGEQDAVRARQRLDEVCAADLSYQNPVITLDGTDALAGHIAELAPLMGSARLLRTTGLQRSGRWYRYGWALQPPLPRVELHGETTLRLGEDLRVTHVVSFHGSAPGRTFLL